MSSGLDMVDRYLYSGYKIIGWQCSLDDGGTIKITFEDGLGDVVIKEYRFRNDRNEYLNFEEGIRKRYYGF